MPAIGYSTVYAIQNSPYYPTLEEYDDGQSDLNDDEDDQHLPGVRVTMKGIQQTVIATIVVCVCNTFSHLNTHNIFVHYVYIIRVVLFLCVIRFFYFCCTRSH